MAGDWIKIEHALPTKPEVMRLAEMLGISELTVVGHLVKFWTWVDLNLSAKCPAVPGTRSGLDWVAGREGFAAAMEAVGWLVFRDGLVEVPNYDEHLSQSAKTRAVESKRKKRRRKEMSAKCPAPTGTQSGHNPGLEKRREEKSIKEPPTPLKLPHDSDAFRIAWERWERHRGELKKPLTPLSRSQQLERLGQLPEAEAIAIINQSIENGWQGLFDLKSGGGHGATKPSGRVGSNPARVHAAPGKYDGIGERIGPAADPPPAEPNLFAGDPPGDRGD